MSTEGLNSLVRTSTCDVSVQILKFRRIQAEILSHQSYFGYCGAQTALSSAFLLDSVYVKVIVQRDFEDEHCRKKKKTTTTRNGLVRMAKHTQNA